MTTFVSFGISLFSLVIFEEIFLSVLSFVLISISFTCSFFLSSIIVKFGFSMICASFSIELDCSGLGTSTSVSMLPKPKPVYSS